MEWYEIILRVLSGLAVVVPLVIKLVEYVKKATKEKNWTDLMTLVVTLMKEAEGLYDDGADRKIWVMSMISASAGTLNYDVDMEKVGEWIDALCDMSKVVNAPDREVSE